MRGIEKNKAKWPLHTALEATARLETNIKNYHDRSGAIDDYCEGTKASTVVDVPTMTLRLRAPTQAI